jgi:hypothetical protein
MSDAPLARLTFVTLGARDISRQAAFYKGLGWALRSEAPDGFTAFQCGGVVLALWPLDLLTAEAAPGAPPPTGTWNGVTLASNVDRREQVDEMLAIWLAKGATLVREPFDTDWGGRSAYVADPEGNRWELCWNPAVAFDDKGAVAGLAE